MARGMRREFLLAAPGEIRPQKTSSRRKAIILMASGIFLLLAVIVSQAAFNLKWIRPNNPNETLVYTALSWLIFLLFVALTFVLGRNIVKLFAERRMGVLGSKFRTRMVVAALLLSSLPVIVMFWFAYGLMNRSIDKWFSSPVEEVREDTQIMVTLLSKYAAANAHAEAESIASSPEVQRGFEGHGFSGVLNEFRRHQTTLQGGFAVAIESGNAEASLG